MSLIKKTSGVSAKLELYFDSRKFVGLFLLRLFIGSRLLYGVVDNVFSWEQMIEFSIFLQNQNIPFPLISAVISVYAQFFCALFILFGYKIRLASAVLVFNFIMALIVHLNFSDTVEGMTPALAMLFGSLCLLFTGADKPSIKNYLESPN